MKSLTYDAIRASISDALAKGVFQDYNISASGISAIIDALAKNSHKMGYMAKMLIDESFRDTAHSLPALRAHAKTRGVDIRGVVPSSTLITVTAQMPAGFAWEECVLKRGQTFAAANSSQDNRVFTVLEDTTILRKSGDVFEGDVLVFEGSLVSRVFDGGTGVRQTFTIPDKGLVLSTLELTTREFGDSSSRVPLPRASTIESAGKDAWWSWLDADNRRVVAMSPTSRQDVMCVWLSSNGTAGNGAQTFTLTSLPPTVSNEIGHAVQVRCSAMPSGGGADIQSADELRGVVDSSYRRQARVISANDVQGYIRDTWGDFRAVQAWGGETEGKRAYGKTMICIVPKSARVMTAGAKLAVRKLLESVGLNGDSFIFVDAKSFEVVVNVVATFKDSALRAVIKSNIEDYWGATRSLVDFSTHEMWVEGKVTGVESLGVTVQLISPATPSQVVDFGVPVSVVSGGTAVDSTRVRATSSEIVVSPRVADFSSPRQSFYTLRQVVVKASNEL